MGIIQKMQDRLSHCVLVLGLAVEVMLAQLAQPQWSNLREVMLDEAIAFLAHNKEADNRGEIVNLQKAKP